MGSLYNSPNLAAFSTQIRKKGIDHLRSRINNELGVFQAAAASTFEQGMVMTQAASGFWQPCTGTDAKGISNSDKVTFGTSINVDEAVVLTGTTPAQLARANVSNVSVRSATGMGGTQYTVTTDYTVNAVAGQVTRVALGAITSGQTVYVTYTFALVDADFNYDGRTWNNNATDMVSKQAGRFSLIQGWSLLYTMQWASGRQYALTGVNGNLYCSTGSQLTNDTTGTPDYLGNCMQLPSASDPYMGVISNGTTVA